MDHIRDLHPDTQSVHAGSTEDQHGAVVPPIYQVSTFAFRDADHGADLFAGRERGYIYSRMLNPTVEALENAVAQLEGGHKALACSSGMAAISTALAATLKQGDHVLCSGAVYGPTTTLLSGIFSKFGVQSTFTDMTELENVRRALRPNTRAVFLESPGNPTLCVLDIAAIASLAREAGARLIVDNTFMSPVLQQPFALGADLVVHSMTKFLNGHADVVAGIIVTQSEDDYLACRKELNQLGGVIDPHQAYLVHRGVRTLALRMERHSSNAQRIAGWLEGHPAVERLWYPGLPSHPQHELARKQMRRMGGMIAFELADGLEAGKHLMDGVRLVRLAVSLGGVESLIQHPASMTHASMAPEVRRAAGITDGLVRISVGVENAGDLIEDLRLGLGE